ncbi:helix-turn-helix transcriptional regulator [Lysinibacter sp. HNR]|uniref:helix-turn-helix domain-containing protein n=1 Tax=Lysinibacter sp. HNR TaxID=3031408 RepID=UPI002434D45F|nr:helix-turn-helix transcriptional regulator [Lysinibacter sp. HNR]WGD37631.1 helix-turn-helix transcriptional regulator [Lysinibacter sp. HNR]
MNSWRQQKVAERVGSRIRSARRVQKLTIESLAEECEMHPTSLGRVERGDTSPTLQTLFRICIALQIDMAELVHGITDESQA